MRSDRTEPQDARKSRPSGWNPEMPERTQAADGDAEFAEPGISGGASVPMEPASRAHAYDDRDVSSSWDDIKGRFVDDPAGAVAAAERLVQAAVEEKVRRLKDEATAVCGAARDDEDSSSTEALRTRLLRCQEYCESLARTSAH